MPYTHEIKTNDELQIMGANAIQQMNANLLNGKGLGSLLTSLGILFSRTEYNSQKKNYQIPKELFNLIKDSFQNTQKTIQSFFKIQTILEDNKEYCNICTLAEIHANICEIAVELKTAQRIKNQEIYIHELSLEQGDKSVIYENRKMNCAIREILINGLKYSKKDDRVELSFGCSDDYFSIFILNKAYENIDGTIGISAIKSEEIFAPFYRLGPDMHEKFMEFEEFSFGMGLFVVRKIIKLNRGDIFINTIDNYSSVLSLQAKRDIKYQKNSAVCVTIQLPCL